MSLKSLFRLAVVDWHLHAPKRISSFAPFLASSRRRNFSVASSNSIRVEVNGVNFHCERVGNGEHPVVLLPGALGCSQTDFKPQIEGLNRNKYTVIAFDPRGFGYSRPPDRDWPLLHLQRDAEDAAAVMQKLGFPKYSILGWSDGGITGLALAGAFPEHVRKLLIWGANAYVTEKDMEMYDAVGDLSKWSKAMLAPMLAVYGEEYFSTQWKKWLEAVMNYYTKRDGDICKDSLPKITCPTLIIHGMKDAMVPEEHARFLQENIKNCRTIDWPLGKHNLHLRFHKEFNETAEEFLDEKDL